MKHLVRDVIEKHVYDAVLVCNGMNHTPYVPQYRGRESFEGEEMHSHDYRVPEIFKGKEVLVIGSGPSGVDITHEISKEANRVFFSQHAINPKFNYGENVTIKPDVEAFTKNGAQFSDGSEEQFSVVLFCTGKSSSIDLI